MVGPIAGPKVLIMPNMTKGNERFGSGKVGTNRHGSRNHTAPIKP